MKKSSLERKILKKLEKRPFIKDLLKFLFKHKKLNILQDYANTVSIKRLGFNDHGPVHIRIAMLNALTMFEILISKGINPSLVEEGIAEEEDSLLAVLCSCFLHDIGMSVNRSTHEFMSGLLAQKYIEEILQKFYPDDEVKQVILQSVITEGIVGHMGKAKIHSKEAGLVLVADGCDLTQGRARIPIMIKKEPNVGDIHRYSAASIDKVEICEGNTKPIAIKVSMIESAGFFQVEETLMGKISASPIKPYIELFAQNGESEILQYL